MLQKKKLEDEIAQAFQDVAATHNVVLEKRQRSNDLAANIERLDAALAAGSGWTDDQKESKVCLCLSCVCWIQCMQLVTPHDHHHNDHHLQGKLEEQRDALQRRSEAKRAAVDAARKQVSLATASLADAEQSMHTRATRATTPLTLTPPVLCRQGGCHQVDSNLEEGNCRQKGGGRACKSTKEHAGQ